MQQYQYEEMKESGHAFDDDDDDDKGGLFSLQILPFFLSLSPLYPVVCEEKASSSIDAKGLLISIKEML